MSINHYSMDLPEATLILMEPTQNPSISWPPYDPLRLNLKSQNHDDDDDNEEEQTTTTATTTNKEEAEDEREPMFEKPLTPSDVGKLNRLVIPKQHAEKYFPLGGGGGGNGDSGECKGLLLSFEDESGKCWRFRYSYWNSSQSYVLTKGWSRYVKDKRLDAGDFVLFERHRADGHRFFIGWRRRQQSHAMPAHLSRAVAHAKSAGDGNNTKNVAASGVAVGWTRGFYSAHPYPTHLNQPFSYQNDSLHAGRGSEGEKQRTRNSSSSRVLRLFGVNMECQAEHDSGPSTPQCSYNSSNLPSTHTTDSNHHCYQPNSSSNPPHHMLRHQPYYY